MQRSIHQGSTSRAQPDAAPDTAAPPAAQLETPQPTQASRGSMESYNRSKESDMDSWEPFTVSL